MEAETGKIVARYDAAGAKFLNAVAADGEGRGYVSDTQTDKIWRLTDGKFEVWLDTPALKTPKFFLFRATSSLSRPWGPDRRVRNEAARQPALRVPRRQNGKGPRRRVPLTPMMLTDKLIAYRIE
jgi:hypothetical protein